MLIHNFPLVELISSHGKNVVVVCSYPVKCIWLYTLLCSECSAIFDSCHSPCLSWDLPNVDDLGRIALLGRGATTWRLRAPAGTLGGDYLWDLDRACIYVSVCINAPGRGQFIVLYICLSCLE